MQLAGAFVAGGDGDWAHLYKEDVTAPNRLLELDVDLPISELLDFDLPEVHPEVMGYLLTQLGVCGPRENPEALRWGR